MKYLEYQINLPTYTLIPYTVYSMASLPFLLEIYTLIQPYCPTAPILCASLHTFPILNMRGKAYMVKKPFMSDS